MIQFLLKVGVSALVIAVASELARRQAASIRQMQRDGIERGGYKSVLGWAKNFRRRRPSQSGQPVLAVSE